MSNLRFLDWHFSQFYQSIISKCSFSLRSLVPVFFFVLRLHFFSCAPFFSGDGFLSLLPNYILFFCFFLFLFLACLSELTEMLQQEKFHTIERNRSYLQVLFSHFYSFHLFHCNYLFLLNVQKFF